MAMRRRTFLLVGAAAALAPRRPAAAAAAARVRITRIVGFDLELRRSKVAGKNSQKDVHGDRARDVMVRIYTSAGVDGLGHCRARREALAQLLGRDPLTYFHREKRRMGGPLGPAAMPLWDLAGKLLNQPAYALMREPAGAAGPSENRVPVYDGSIYFADLLPQYAGRWRDRFREEIDMGRAAGHQAFKIKIGRGAKWMPREAGDARDVDVVRLIREHAGRDVLLGVDANNGYDLEGTKRFLDRVGDCDLAFTEEMFPESVAACLEQKAYMKAKGWRTLLADGETQRELEAYRPLFEARAIDVVQGDMRRFGVDGILDEGAMARPHGVLVAPHNWGSLIGFYMQLHVALAIPNFYRAEHDPLASDLLRAEGYEIEDGCCSVPDAPGFGLSLDERRFQDVNVKFDLRA